METRGTLSKSTAAKEKSQCDIEVDLVARRLEAAERTRRADYDRELAARRGQCPCAVMRCDTYRLRHELECARATDGRDYQQVDGGPPAAPSACTGGQTPTPCCIRLAPAGDCQLRDDSRLDHCAHTPRILLNIDRSSREQTTHTTHRPTETKPMKFTNRIIKTLGAITGRSANDGNTSTSGQRKLHTSTVDTTNASDVDTMRSKVKSDTEKLAAALNDKSKLKNAGRGRVVTQTAGAAQETFVPAGSLELGVPQSSSSVRVDVSVRSAFPALFTPVASSAPALTTLNCTSSEKQESWLSNLQKKIAAYRPRERTPSADQPVSQPASPSDKFTNKHNCPPASPSKPRTSSPKPCPTSSSPPKPCPSSIISKPHPSSPPPKPGISSTFSKSHPSSPVNPSTSSSPPNPCPAIPSPTKSCPSSPVPPKRSAEPSTSTPPSQPFSPNPCKPKSSNKFHTASIIFVKP